MMSAGLGLFGLAIVQLTGRKRFVAVALIALVPVLLALLIAVLADLNARERVEFRDGIVGGLLVTLVLPLIALVLATASFGDEMGDRTLIYQVLKPVSRWTIVVPKIVAGSAVVALVLATSGVLSGVLILSEDATGAAATAAALALGGAAYVAIFTWAGLVSRHALAFGLVYVFLWESSLSSLFEGIRFFSVRQYAFAVAQGIDSNLLRTHDTAELSLVEGLAGVAIVVALFAFLTKLALERMDVP
jgi:ABC-2 type transport system permease protein